MLSKVEIEVLKRIAMKNHDIAAALGFSRSNVENRVTNIMTKLEVDTRVAAAYKALNIRLLTIDDFVIPEVTR